MEFTYLLIVFMPLVGFLFCGFFILYEMTKLTRLSSKMASIFVVFCTFISAILSVKLFYLNAIRSTSYFFNNKYFNWIVLESVDGYGRAGFLLNKEELPFDFASFLSNFFMSKLLFNSSYTIDLKWGFFFDPLTSTMLLVITFVSLLVQLYSIEYMSHDLNRMRFMSYLSLFVFFMILLVTSDNFIQMFIGWEGVGLVSYLLINFWFTRVEAARSALKAIGVNKIGDFGIVMAILLNFYFFGTVDYDFSFYYADSIKHNCVTIFDFDFNVFTLIGFFLLIGAVGKSAQLGLHTWLPDAMEGPTPVSALIHAATMVTAGVYLLVRCSPFIEKSSIILTFIVIIGATTAFFGATTAFFQNDLKKIIAYSTCSQLGYMVFVCGFSGYSAAMFHLVNHAFFKALLFLCAGSVIHAMNDEQDIRKMGGLVKILPFTYSVMLIGSLSLSGFPFLSGYYSKDLILEIAASMHTFVGFYSFTLAVLAAFFTVLYSIRLSYLTFLLKTNAFKKIIDNAREPQIFMIVPLVVLAILSVISGKFLFEIFIGNYGFINIEFWQTSIFINLNNLDHLGDLHALNLFYVMLPLFFIFFGFILSFLFYWLFSPLLTRFFFKNYGQEIYLFFNKKWYFDVIYSNFLTKKFYIFGYKFLFKSIDRGLLNFLILPIFVDGLLLTVRQYKIFHSGFIYSYIYIIVLGVIFFLAFFL